ncbi:nuclease-related domain-containing protein [Prescottella equi]|uniref:nuclease-related domain-containing protein n=1 Tax=Rhodococcus hoagii TaxID=43767 RepID=UPI00384F37FA
MPRLARVVRKDPRWRVLHAIPVGVRGSDIDHLVVGPGGVFTVDAKHHPRADIWVAGSTFLVNGTRQPYIRNSRHEAARAAKLLTAACGFDVAAEPVIVTVNARAVTVKSPPDGVHVVPRMHVARWLLRQRDVHPPETVEALYEAARRSTTWQP